MSQTGEYVSAERVAAWSALTTGGFRTEVLPGDHFFIEKQQPLLLTLLPDSLRQTLNGLSR